MRVVGCDMPVSVKGYVHLVHQLARQVKDAPRKIEDDWRELVKRDVIIKEFNLKVKVIFGDSEKVAQLQVQVTAKGVQLTDVRAAPLRPTRVLESVTFAHVSRRPELDALPAAEERLEGVLRDFAETVCTGYSALMCTRAARYCIRLIALLSNAESRGESVLGAFALASAMMATRCPLISPAVT